MQGRRRRGRGRALTTVVALGLAACAQLGAAAAAAQEAAAPDGPGALSNYRIADGSAWSRLIECRASASATWTPAAPPSAR
jgi:ferric-dicitrate binding protein FerR (iron transport regulator)